MFTLCTSFSVNYLAVGLISLTWMYYLPYLEAQLRLHGVSNVVLLGVQRVDQQICIFGGLIELIVLSKAKVLQTGKRRHTGPSAVFD